jgi:hypothetical protein
MPKAARSDEMEPYEIRLIEDQFPGCSLSARPLATVAMSEAA